MNSNFNTQETWYSTVDGSAIGLYQDKPSLTASVECEPEHEQEFDRELVIEAVHVHACIWDVNSSTYKDKGTKQNAFLLPSG